MWLIQIAFDEAHTTTTKNNFFYANFSFRFVIVWKFIDGGILGWKDWWTLCAEQKWQNRSHEEKMTTTTTKKKKSIEKFHFSNQ